jgi:glycosyltransferase involved in cell wall biosynthesis
MKVAILTYLYHPDKWGGAPRSAYLLARGLRDSGAKVLVVATHGGPDQVTDEDGIRVHRLSPRNLYWVAEKDAEGVLMKTAWQTVDLWNPWIYRTVGRILRAERPDVVHVHKMRGLSPSVWAAARRAGSRAIIQTCRDYELLSPEGTLTSRLGRMAGRDSLPTRPYRMLRAAFSRTVDGATAPSRHTLRAHLERGFFPNARSAVIPNSHGLPRAGLPRRGAVPVDDPGQIRVLYLGRVESTKGVLDLCEAFTRLPASCAPATLDVVGDGGELPSLRRRFGDHPRIVFHGALHGSGKEKMLQECLVVVAPSVWPEVFGNVIAEAFSYGKPVIGTSVGAIPELIDHGVTGMLVRPADPDGLAGALATFIQEPSTARSMTNACLESGARFSLDAVVEGYARFYDRVMEGASGQPTAVGHP